MLKAIHFGAGNIGRGFIGQLLYKSNYHITFVDLFDGVVNDINKYKEYEITILSDVKIKDKVLNIKAINLKDTEKLKEAILNADLVTTSIGANNLKGTAEFLKEVLLERQKKNPEALLDIIACENALFATDIIKETILKDAEEDFKKYINEKVGFPNSAVDRIVPNTKSIKNSPIDVAVEEFYEWDIEKHKIKLNKDIIGSEYTENLEPYLERKLFMLNGAHATVAYMGHLKKYEFIHEAIEDNEIRQAVIDFHKECVQVLHLKHNMSIESLESYGNKIIKRFKNFYLQDVISRVGRDPIRKLSNKDRLVSPLKLCLEFNKDYEEISRAIAAGLLFNDKNDEKSVEIQKLITDNGIENTIEKVTGLTSKEAINKIERSYVDLIK